MEKGQIMTVGAVSSAPAATIPLGRLIDFAIQQTYTDLTLLADLLPRKSDMERKIEITKFTNMTRQLFVRLLALVRWASSAGKVEKCATIVNFLDKQSLLFIETADMFAMLSRDTLVQARLPSFHIPCAAEILTTGSYSRLPTCIRDKIVPPDPISVEEKKDTLERLNGIIQYRLVSAELPPQMTSLDINRGRVLFKVDNEFEVSLTVMGDGPQMPWRLLHINILVEDKDTGDCRALVHPLQVNYIHQVMQSRLVDHPKPLQELYEGLHFFCLSLQLEVLHSQIVRLCRERLGDSLRIEEYSPGTNLKLHFWRDHLSLVEQRPFYLLIHVDNENPCKPLQISHSPEIEEKEEQVWIDTSIRSDFLSVEKLLIQTIHIRSRQKLRFVQKNFFQDLLGDQDCSLGGSPPLLQIPVVQPCSSSENLVLTIDTHTGYVMAFVPQYEPPMVTELQDAINEMLLLVRRENLTQVKRRLANAFLNLKFWMTLKRCKKTVQHLPVLALDSNPVSCVMPEDHQLNTLSKYTLFVKLCKHAFYYVVIELRAESAPDPIEYKYYLMSVTSESKLSSFYELDSHSIIHGPCTDMDIVTLPVNVPTNSSKKRAANGPQTNSANDVKRPKFAGYYISDVAHIVAFCDDRLPFCAFTRELELRGICHRGLQIEGAQTNFCVKIVQMPPNKEVSEKISEELRRCLLSCTFRLQVKGVKAWLCELIFHGCPLTTNHIRERGETRPIYFMYDFSQNNMGSIVDEWLADWTIIAKLYGVVLEYAEDMKKEKFAPLLEMSEVRSFSYKRLTLAYGPDKSNTVTIYWRPVEKRFQLVFSVVGPSVSSTNPHTLISHQLCYDFNQHESIIELLQTLRDTYRPLLSLSRLPSTPQLGVINSRPQVPVQSFMIIPQSSTCFKLVYRGMYCLEVQCRKGDGCVIVRDGSFSHFDKSRNVEDYMQIPSFRAFFGKFSAGDEVNPLDPDNPVSPLQMQSIDAFLSPSMTKAGSPASNRSGTDSGMRFSQHSGLHHHPMTPPSNPHTPASPHPSMLPSSYTASPNPAFVHTPTNIPPSSPLAPPPSSPYPVNSPHMTSPSPSPAQQQLTTTSSASQNFTNADPTSPAFPLLSASPANPWPPSPAPPRPSPRQFLPSPGGPSPVSSGQSSLANQPSSVELRQSSMHANNGPSNPSQWSATMPLVLTHENLDVLCTPSSPCHSPIEKLLGCAFMRNTILRFVRSDEKVQLRNLNEPGVIIFCLDQLTYRVSLNAQTMQSLHVKISHNEPPANPPPFTPDDIQVIECYFDTKVVSIPYKPNAFTSFTRLMNTPQRILKDFVQLMRLELCPTQSGMFRWNFQLCLTIPPAAPQIAPPGMTSVVITRGKMLFFIQLFAVRHQTDPNQLPVGNQPSIVVPMVYDLQTNIIGTALERRPPEMNAQSSQAIHLIGSILRRCSEYQNNSECSIFSSIREVLTQLPIN